MVTKKEIRNVLDYFIGGEKTPFTDLFEMSSESTEILDMLFFAMVQAYQYGWQQGIQDFGSAFLDEDTHINALILKRTNEIGNENTYAQRPPHMAYRIIRHFILTKEYITVDDLKTKEPDKQPYAYLIRGIEDGYKAYVKSKQPKKEEDKEE
jgi:hypothetical protein